MTASTSARVASAQTSLVRDDVPVAAGEAVALAPVPAGDVVAVGDDVAAVRVGDAVPVATAAVGDAPESPPGAQAVERMSAKSAIDAIVDVLMRYM